MQQEVATAVDSAYSADELGPYSSVSSLSVAALLLGLLSPLVMISPLLLIFPLAAIGVAGAALLKIGAADGQLSGARLARWGLVLAIVFGVASVTRAQISQVLYQRQIAAVVEPWLKLLVEGRHEEALWPLSPDAASNLASSTIARSAVPAFRTADSSEALAKNRVVQALLQLGTPARLPEVVIVTWALRETEIFATSREMKAVCSYEATNNRGESLAIAVELSRPTSLGDATTWLIQGWQ
ncbi:MAG: hypothetical protein MK171_02010 [Pirellulales bacterium]|nr:hypothetical protein [Pirellulales bacterium]